MVIRPVTNEGKLDPWAIAGWLVTAIVGLLCWVTVTAIADIESIDKRTSELERFRVYTEANRYTSQDAARHEAKQAETVATIYREMNDTRKETAQTQKVIGESLARLSTQMEVANRAISKIEDKIINGQQ